MNFIVLCLCVSLSGVLCEYLNLDAGDKCEWEGLQGTCVDETRCLTTIDDDSPKHPICYKDWNVKIICCTDCELVNSTENAMLIPPGGLFFKSGQKARDSCLQYIQKLPYKCKADRFYVGISRYLDEDDKCYKYSEWEVESSSEERNKNPTGEHPYTALLGYGGDLALASWFLRGAIISNKYILTSAMFLQLDNGPTFVALDIKKLSDGPTAWQTDLVKRVVIHPDYLPPQRYNNIGLIETENTIILGKNVLPACLPVETVADETAFITTWTNSDSEEMPDTIQTVHLDKYSVQECKSVYDSDRLNETFNYGFNYNTQMCYGSRLEPTPTCEVNDGQPLLVNTQFSRCVHTIIGVFAFGNCASRASIGPTTVFTRVAPYTPWIERVVWARDVDW